MAKKQLREKAKLSLTAAQEAFVSAFIEEAELDKNEAARIANAAVGTSITAPTFLKSEAVQKAIHLRMVKSSLWLSEAAIIDRLFKEGMTANSASARVNALVWVGKHLGMWQEKEQEESQTVYNIVNYGTSEAEMAKVIEAKPEVESSIEQAVLPEGVAVLKYNKD